MRALALLGLSCVLGACADRQRAGEHTPETPLATAAPAAGFPHLRIDRAQKSVEIDGYVPIDARPTRNGKPNRVYLEVLLCSPNTREHEALVVTHASPSHIHAALLALGLAPGSPGAWRVQNNALVPVPPTGDRVRVSVRIAGDDLAENVPIERWVVSTRDDSSLAQNAGAEGFVFAGSRFLTPQPAQPRPGEDLSEVYGAEVEGTIVGLSTFGTETVAWTQLFHPQASVESPHWIADGDSVPPRGTPVVVTIRAEP